jgi:hypothetical protein
VIQHLHSAAQRGGVEAFAPTEIQTLPQEFEILEQPCFRQLALILAIQQIGTRRGHSLRQQATIWSPFR